MAPRASRPPRTQVEQRRQSTPGLSSDPSDPAYGDGPPGYRRRDDAERRSRHPPDGGAHPARVSRASRALRSGLPRRPRPPRRLHLSRSGRIRPRSSRSSMPRPIARRRSRSAPATGSAIPSTISIRSIRSSSPRSTRSSSPIRGAFCSPRPCSIRSRSCS